MTDMRIECLHDFREFQSVRDDWNEFTESCLPDNYSRTHAWLSAWWDTYHSGKPAIIYLQRDPATGRIVAAAPLLIRKEIFGGFPVRSLQILGSGIGTDDFLIGPEARGFVPAVLNDLVNNHDWHVATLHRLSSPLFHDDVRQICSTLGCSVDCTETEDYLVRFPAGFEEYLQNRSRKFRRNFNQALNRLKKEGAVTLEILDPFRDAQRVYELGREVAMTSWQFRAGKSHFNENGVASFYANLAKTGHCSSGEEFTVLKVGDRPVAYLLSCRRGRTYYAVDTAFHADYRHVSAGRILFGMIFERLIDEGGIDCFDFEGSGDYKDDYATHTRNTNLILVYHRNLYPRLIRLAKRSKMYAFLKGQQNRLTARMKRQSSGPPTV